MTCNRSRYAMHKKKWRYENIHTWYKIWNIYKRTSRLTKWFRAQASYVIGLGYTRIIYGNSVTRGCVTDIHTNILEGWSHNQLLLPRPQPIPVDPITTRYEHEMGILNTSSVWVTNISTPNTSGVWVTNMIINTRVTRWNTCAGVPAERGRG